MRYNLNNRPIPATPIESYNPFDKRLADLTAPDLAILKTVIEGWHVEYKRALVSASQLAKAISSFANTYGGWLFLGVGEAGKSDPVAGSFPGIPSADLDTARQRIRQAASQHLNPTPHFETKVVVGPCEDIDLELDKAVIAVQVPQSVTAPHIHKDGRIYRRAGDSSEPKPETDRFAIDQLSERANGARRTVSEWVHRDPSFSAIEKRTPYLRFMFCLDPWMQRNPKLDTPLPEIRDLFTNADDISRIVFNAIYPEPGGFVARQVMSDNPQQIGLTCRIKWDLRCDLIVPIPIRAGATFRELREVLKGYDNASGFVDLLESQGFRDPCVADLNFVMSILLAVVGKYRRLISLSGATDASFHFKARALNFQYAIPSRSPYGSSSDAQDFQRVVPFIDIGEIVEDFRRYGVPVPMDTIVTLPFGDGPDSFLELPSSGDQTDIEQTVQHACLVFALSSALFGFSLVEQDGESSPKSRSQADSRASRRVIVELVKAGTRAFAVQSRLKG